MPGESLYARVLVVMSVYNGEQYLQEQVDSILSQENANPDLLVRDDGSTDSTARILERIRNEYPRRVSVISGPNIGAAKSFLEALFSAPMDYDFYALSDADDVWLSDKVAAQVKFLRSMATTAGRGRAVVSQMEIVDSALGHLGQSSRPPRGFSFSNALIQTVFNGAASMFDLRAMEILRTDMPRFVTMHDSWLYLVFSARASIEYLPQPVLKYRQHGANIFGVTSTWRERLARRWKPFRHPDFVRERMARELLRIHGPSLASEESAALNRYLMRHASVRARLSYALVPAARMQRPVATFYHRLLVALHRA